MAKFNYLAVAIGAAVFIGTAYSAYSTFNYIDSTLTADGVVIATPIGPHHPDVVFTDGDGNRITFSANGDISQNVGDRVNVRYSRKNPERTARLDTFSSLWGGTLMLLAVSVCFIVAGVRNVPFRGWGKEQ
jgi:hypothetical protein